MSNEQINVSIGAKIDALLVGLEEAKGAVAASVGEMKANMASLGEVVASVQAPFLALTGLLAGGALFKEAVSGTIEWTGDVIQLSKRLGITTEEASGLKVALDHLGISTDEYGTIVTKVTRQMRTNHKAFEDLGIRTKDSNGEWRNSQEIMTAVIDRLSHMKAGTDRNVAAQALLGGRVGDVTKLLRLTSEALQEGADKAAKFHLIVGPDGEQKMRAYKSGMADLHLISESLKVQIGNALIPVLTDLGSWFGEHGPAMANAFQSAIRVMRVVIAEFAGDIRNLSDELGGLFNQVNIAGDALRQAMSIDLSKPGGFTAAKNAIVAGLKDINAQAQLTALGIEANNQQTADGIAAMLNPIAPKKQSRTDTDTTSGDSFGGGDPLAAQKKEWELAQAGYKLREAQAAESEQEIIDIKAAAAGKALQLFGKDSTQYLAAATDLQDALNKATKDGENKRRELETKAMEERKQEWQELLSGISTAIQTSVTGIIQGTTTMAAAIKNLLKSIALEYVSMTVKTLVAHKAAELAKTGATAQGTAQRVALESWAAIRSVAIGAWEAIMRIGQYAIEGAAAAFKSIAAIPVVGPFLAPAAAAAAGITILGFAGQVASARGGFDIPSGVNPMTQLHQSEMVLPAELANRVRGMTDAGSGGDVHFHIHAIDRKGVRQFFDEHGDHIVRVIQRKERDFHFDTGV